MGFWVVSSRKRLMATAANLVRASALTAILIPSRIRQHHPKGLRRSWWFVAISISRRRLATQPPLPTLPCRHFLQRIFAYWAHSGQSSRSPAPFSIYTNFCTTFKQLHIDKSWLISRRRPCKISSRAFCVGILDTLVCQRRLAYRQALAIIIFDHFGTFLASVLTISTQAGAGCQFEGGERSMRSGLKNSLAIVAVAVSAAN